MDEKTSCLGLLSVSLKPFGQSHTVSLVRGQSIWVPLLLFKVTPMLDPRCGHLTFVESSTFHLFANRLQRYDANVAMKWVPDLAAPDYDLSACQQKNLERFYESPEEREHIAKFFHVATSKESIGDREERFATQPIMAFKGFCEDLTCLKFQYGLKEKFVFKDIKLCKQGAHACLLPWHVFRFYPRGEKNRYFRVLIAGAKQHGEDKSVAEQIELVDELSEKELAQLNGVFETPMLSYLHLRGRIVGLFDHALAEVVWTWGD